jgi:quercetin dioxygenase-like cupin family protein
MTANDTRASSVVHVGPAAGEVVDVLGDVLTFKLPGAATGGSLILGEIVVQPGGGPPGLHTHPPDEAFYVLAGEFEVSGVGADGQPFAERATPGSVIYVPPGAPHTFKNVGATPGRLLAVYTAPTMERAARELAALGADGALPDPAEVMAVLERYEFAFVGSPPGRR